MISRIHKRFVFCDRYRLIPKPKKAFISRKEIQIVAWKEFLKPDWRKIIVYENIMGFIFILPLLMFLPPTCPISSVCRKALIWAFKVIFAALIPVYLVSCFYVWFYDMLRKRL
jgi:hypothetical protein